MFISQTFTTWAHGRHTSYIGQLMIADPFWTSATTYRSPTQYVQTARTSFDVHYITVIVSFYENRYERKTKVAIFVPIIFFTFVTLRFLLFRLGVWYVCCVWQGQGDIVSDIDVDNCANKPVYFCHWPLLLITRCGMKICNEMFNFLSEMVFNEKRLWKPK